MWVAGIDYSTTCPGITIKPIGEEWYDFYWMIGVEKYLILNLKGQNFSLNGTVPCVSRSEERINHYRTQANWTASIVRYCKLVMIEDYAYGAKGKAFHIGECTGLLKAELEALGIPYKVASPSKIKKFATGKGNANKEEMWYAFVEQTGIDLINLLDYKKKDIESPLADIVDSYFIAQLAEQHYNG